MTYFYQICLEGQLDEHWAAWFDGLDLTITGDGRTTLAGPVVDQAALHGLLARIRDLGLPILSVVLLEPESLDARQSI